MWYVPLGPDVCTCFIIGVSSSSYTNVGRALFLLTSKDCLLHRSNIYSSNEDLEGILSIEQLDWFSSPKENRKKIIINQDLVFWNYSPKSTSVFWTDPENSRFNTYIKGENINQHGSGSFIPSLCQLRHPHRATHCPLASLFRGNCLVQSTNLWSQETDLWLL